MQIFVVLPIRTKFSRYIYNIFKNIYILGMLVFAFGFQLSVTSLWAGDKIDSLLSLDKTIELALNLNKSKQVAGNFLPPEDVVFLVKKYYFQIQIQREQLDTAEEVRDHFKKAVNKSEINFEEGEGNVSQSDIAKLKLGLSEILNEIIGLKHNLQIAKLYLGDLIGKKLKLSNDLDKVDIVPVDFLFNKFTDYLKSKSFSPLFGIKLKKRDNLTLHKAFIDVKEAKAKVVLGKKNRKITRALLVAEVANYDFGIGDSQELFEALVIYTRVLSSYLESIYTFNVAVAKLEKLTVAIYK